MLKLKKRCRSSVLASTKFHQHVYSWNSHLVTRHPQQSIFQELASQHWQFPVCTGGSLQTISNILCHLHCPALVQCSGFSYLTDSKQCWCAPQLTHGRTILSPPVSSVCSLATDEHSIRPWWRPSNTEMEPRPE